MIKIALKHWIYEACIERLFDAVFKNFFMPVVDIDTLIPLYVLNIYRAAGQSNHMVRTWYFRDLEDAMARYLKHGRPLNNGELTTLTTLAREVRCYMDARGCQIQRLS